MMATRAPARLSEGGLICDLRFRRALPGQQAPEIVGRSRDDVGRAEQQHRFLRPDADGDDYINTMEFIGWTDHDSGSVIRTDGTNITAIQAKTYNFADVTLGGAYERAFFLFTLNSTTANQMEVSWVQYEYYYA